MRGLSHIAELEAESIQIIREVAAEFQKPVMLYSIGKDSQVIDVYKRQAYISLNFHVVSMCSSGNGSGAG